jgi:hypothetical protein
MVGRATDAPTHLCSQLDNLSVHLASSDGCDRCKRDLSSLRIPRKHFKIVLVLQLRVETFKLDQSNSAVESDDRSLIA